MLLALIASAIAPYDRATWLLEVAPVLIAAPVLLLSHRSFPLTRLLYVVIAIHALILILGGTYTYAKVPPGFWVQEWFDLSRNPYDKLGHFIQGVTPALLAREILLRRRFVVPGKMLGFLAVCVALAFSAFYELIEWWVALLAGQGAVDFLGTQGDPGIPSPTCSWRCSVRYCRSACWRARRTGRSSICSVLARRADAMLYRIGADAVLLLHLSFILSCCSAVCWWPGDAVFCCCIFRP